MDEMFEEDMMGFDVERGSYMKPVDANVNELVYRKQVLAELLVRFEAQMTDYVAREGGLDQNNYFLNMLRLKTEQIRGEIKWIETYLEKHIG